MIKKYRNSIEGLGIKFKFQSMILIFLFMEICTVAAALLYLTKWQIIIVLGVIALITVPGIYKARILYIFEQQRFDNLCNYMQQMCASFQTRPKIYSALKDAVRVLDGKFKDTVLEAIDSMETKNISYADTLAIIEKNNDCKKLRSIHNLFVKVEEEGGEYHYSLNLLIKDVSIWQKRVLKYQEERKTMKVHFAFGLIISLITCCLATILAFISNNMEDDMMGAFLNITGIYSYQIVCFIFIAACIVSYWLLEKRLAETWLDVPKKDKYIIEDYNTTLTYNAKKKTLYMIPFFALGIIAAAALFYFGLTLPAILVFLLAVIVLSFPSIKYKGAKKRTINEIKTAFPEWLIDIELNLQFYTLHIAIVESLNNCPVVLKIPIEKLIMDIDKDMEGIGPYSNFLSEFNLSEIRSAMMMLSSVRELDRNNSEQLLNIIIDRNFDMQSTVEEKNLFSKLSNLKTVLYAPTGFAAFKIVADLLIFATTFFSGFSNISNFINY